jgi:hypothetical protein
MVGREPDRAGVLGDVTQPQRGSVVDEHAQDAPADRKVADRGPLGLGHAGGDELADGAIGAQDAEGAVAGAGQVGGQVDDPLQDDREQQLRGEGEPGLQQALGAVTLAHHRGSVTVPCRPGNVPAPWTFGRCRPRPATASSPSSR